MRHQRSDVHLKLVLRNKQTNCYLISRRNQGRKKQFSNYSFASPSSITAESSRAVVSAENHLIKIHQIPLFGSSRGEGVAALILLLHNAALLCWLFVFSLFMF